MQNNDVLRRVRYIFDYSDEQMIEIFAAAEQKVERAEVSDWLKREDDPEFQELSDRMLATFLNGLINKNRGKREGEQPQPEDRITNNLIFKKLKIALDMKAEDVLQVLDLANFKLGKSELSAFFRKKGSRQYRICQDQVLRNFFMGLQKKYRQQSAQMES
ncbi:MAG: DUF1456 family protein [Candidatus Cloacimonadales bacterium]